MGDARPRFLSMNGEIVPYDQARVHILTPLAKYGAGVFEGIRAYWNPDSSELHIFRLREHLQRLRFSMKVMRFDAQFDDLMLTRALLELIRANEMREDIHIRLMVHVEGDGEMSATGPIGWSIAALPRPTTPKVRNGIHVATSAWQRISDLAMPPRVKANANYNNSRLAAIQGQIDGYDNVLFLTRNGHVSESPGSCFFMLRDGVPITPGVTSSILESVTRATLLQLFSESFGKTSVERDVDRTEIYAAEEAFFCGSGHEITPILTLDRLPIGDGKVGPVTHALQDRYFAVVRGQSKDHPEWRMGVYRSN